MGELEKRIRNLLCTTEQYPAIEEDLPIIIIKEPNKILEIVGEMRKEFPFSVDSEGMLIAKAYIVEREGYENAPYSNEYEELTKWFVKWLADEE